MNKSISSTQAKQLNGAALAYLGDAVYETFVRRHVLSQGKTHPNRLHQASVTYVEASAQAAVMRHWLDLDDYLTQEEIDLFRRGRNHRANTKAKNASIADYRFATGFEALLGWLALSEQTERLNELMQAAITWLDQPKEESHEATSKRS